MGDETLEALLGQLGIAPPRRPPPRQSPALDAARDRFTTRPPAIDPNSMQSVAGQVAPTVRREDLRPLPTRQEQEREYARLQQSPREAPAYQAPMNQFADAGNQIVEGTGLPSVRRSAAAFADNRPREGLEQGAMGALSLATLGVGGRSAMPGGNARPTMRPSGRRAYHGGAFSGLSDEYAPTWWSEDPRVASSFAEQAEGGQVVPADLNLGRNLSIRATDPREVNFRGVNPLTNWSERQYLRRAWGEEGAWADDILDFARSRGYDSLTLRGAREAGRSQVSHGMINEGGVRYALDPAPSMSPAEPRPGALRPPVRNPMRPEMPPIEARPAMAPDAPNGSPSPRALEGEVRPIQARPDAGSRGAGPSFGREASEAARRTRGLIEVSDILLGQRLATQAEIEMMAPRSARFFLERAAGDPVIAAQALRGAIASRRARLLREPRDESARILAQNELAQNEAALALLEGPQQIPAPNAPARGPSREVLDVPVSSGQTTEVIRNPSRADLARLSVLPRELAADPNIRANAAGQLRYIVDAQGDVFVFRGWDAIHDDVARGMARMGRRPSGYQADDGSRSDFGRFGYLRREGDRFVSGNGEPLPLSVERLINPRGPSQ